MFPQIKIIDFSSEYIFIKKIYLQFIHAHTQTHIYVYTYDIYIFQYELVQGEICIF